MERDAEIVATRDLCNRLDGVSAESPRRHSATRALPLTELAVVWGAAGGGQDGQETRWVQGAWLRPPTPREGGMRGDIWHGSSDCGCRVLAHLLQTAVHQHWDASGTSAAKQLKFLSHVRECAGVTKPVLEKCVPTCPHACTAGGRAATSPTEAVRSSDVTPRPPPPLSFPAAGTAKRRRSWSARCRCTDSPHTARCCTTAECTFVACCRCVCVDACSVVMLGVADCARHARVDATSRTHTG